MTVTNNLSKFGASLNDDEVAGNFIRQTEKNVSNGLLVLDGGGKVPMNRIQTDAANVIPTLNSETKLPNVYLDLGYMYMLTKHFGG